MADFCKQCSEELWGEDTKDLCGVGDKTEVLEEGEGFAALCESCGPILVDHVGQCLGGILCLERHETPSVVVRTWSEDLVKTCPH